EEDAAPRELHRSRGIRDRAPADPGGARGRASSARAGGDDGVGAPSLPRPLPRGRARADARRMAPGRRPEPGAVARRAHGARVMHSEWLRVGDHAVSFTDPQWLPLAAGAVVFVVAALITHGRRRAAWRDGRIASTEAVRLWLATLLRPAAYLCVVAALAGIAIVEPQREDRLAVVALRGESASISPSERQWITEWLEGLVAAMWPDDELTLFG